MYTSIDFATKSEFRQAVQQHQPVVVYSPNLGMPAINGIVTVTGPWPVKTLPAPGDATPAYQRRQRIHPAWTARVEVKDMVVVAVH